MNLSYRGLEKDYYKTLHEMAHCFKIKGKLISKTRLPYLLENTTSFRLKSGRHWIISAISGSGKTTISKQLVLAGFNKLPNVTTRTKRSKEKNSECIFVNNSKFLLWKHHDLLFHPHKRNGVWQALLKKDIKKLTKKNSFFCLDKSVASSIILKNALPQKVQIIFLYILTPSFKELYKRILKREASRGKKEKPLSKKEIFKRFNEEINDMKMSIKLPYAYIVNDSLKRVKKFLNKTIKHSEMIRKS